MLGKIPTVVACVFAFPLNRFHVTFAHVIDCRAGWPIDQCQRVYALCMLPPSLSNQCQMSTEHGDTPATAGHWRLEVVWWS